MRWVSGFVSILSKNVRDRAESVPAWLWVMLTAGVVGSVSAMLSVVLLGNITNQEESALSVPSESHEQ